MADPAELVTLKLTFWHKDKKPGDTVQVRRDEIPMWRGFAVPVEDEPKDTPQTEQTEQATAETKPNETAPSTEAEPTTPAKTSRTSKA